MTAGYGLMGREERTREIEGLGSDHISVPYLFLDVPFLGFLVRTTVLMTTAQNEEEIGQAVKASDVPRKDIWLTSKVRLASCILRLSPLLAYSVA